MVFVDYKVTWIPRKNNAWDPLDGEEISGVIDPLISRSLGTSRDTFSLKLLNNGSFDNKFNATDKILISRAINSTVHTSDDLIVTGVIRDAGEVIDKSKDELRLEGFSFSEVMLNAITFIDATNLPMNEALEKAVEAVQLYSPGFQLTWSPTNPTTRLDGSPFPVVGERWFNKRLGELFERYSSRIYTGDSVNYYFFVDQDNNLYWQPQVDASSSSFNSETDKYMSLKDGKDVNGVVNFVIIKGGFDPAGQQIQTRYQDFASSNKHGLKYKVIPAISKNAQVLIKQDMDSLGITTGTVPSVSLGSTYSFTTTWKSRVTGNSVTVTNDAEYVDAVRTHILEVLRAEALEFVEARKSGKLKVTINFKAGDTTWIPGSVIRVVLPKLFREEKNLRVHGIQLGAEVDVVELVEDEGSI